MPDSKEATNSQFGLCTTLCQLKVLGNGTAAALLSFWDPEGQTLALYVLIDVLLLTTELYLHPEL